MGSDLLSIFKERGAILEGHFLLSSGLHSPRYLQCARVLMDPVLATRLGGELGGALKGAVRDKVSTVVAPAIGGILVAHEVARALGVPGIFTERDASSVMTLRRGFRLEPDERVVVVEDVLTTGKSTREVMGVVLAVGARVVGVGSLVDRSSGIDLGVPFRSLLKLEVPTYEAEACPLCAEGSRPTKPGSRPEPIKG